MVRVTLVVLLLVFFIFGGYGWHDAQDAITYCGTMISPTYVWVGEVVFIFLLFFMIFTDEFIKLFKKINKIRIEKRHV